jgi:acetyl-CoA synthetase
MAGLDWSRIRAFSSTGECSNSDDMRWLMQLAGDKPIIEYCGGTEVGGGYLTSTVVQPNTPAAFTTPALGVDIAIIDEDGKPTDDGEAYLVGPSMGLSRRLLNRDHDQVYFAETPIGPNGYPLRKHGDGVKKLPGGGYVVAGRTDDTMNLGGVKVGCAELERALVKLPQVRDVAAVAVPPPGGGPSRLILFIVPRDDATVDEMHLKVATQQAIRQELNPLFKVDQVRLVSALPRTASNKVMRRELRKLVD